MGMFDDLIPDNQAQEPNQEAPDYGMFADLVPKAEPKTQSNQVAPEQNQSLNYGSVFADSFNSLKDAFQGKEGGLPEVGSAPELNEFSARAAKSGLGLLTTANDQSMQKVLEEQFGDTVSFKPNPNNPEETQVDLPSGSYVINRDGMSARDSMKLIYDMALFSKSIGKTILGTVGKSAGTQVVNDTLEGAVGGDGVNVKETAIAGGIGGAAKTAEKVIGGVYNLSKGKIDDAAQETIEAAQKSNIPLLTSDVIQPEGITGKLAQSTAEKVPYIGTGALREGQEKMREQAVNEFTRKYSEYSYGAVVDSLKAQKDKVKSAAGSVLEKTGKQLDEVGEVSLNYTNQALKMADSELNKAGVIQSNEAIRAADQIATTLKEAPQTFSTLKENRTALREIIKGLDKAEKSQLGSRAKALLNNVASSMGRDMDEIAKANLTPKQFNQWKNANKVYADEATKLTKTKIKNVLDKGDTTPEVVKQMIFSKNPSEVKLLYKSLTNEGRQNVRAAIINDTLETLSKRVNDLTPNTFYAEMQKRGLAANTFFKGEEKKQLSGLLKALKATRRAGEAGVATPTGQSLFGLLGIGAATTAPTTTLALGSTVAATARSYESSAVRNALLRLDSLPADSSQFQEALSQVFRALNGASQSSVDVEQ